MCMLPMGYLQISSKVVVHITSALPRQYSNLLHDGGSGSHFGYCCISEGSFESEGLNQSYCQREPDWFIRVQIEFGRGNTVTGTTVSPNQDTP